MRHRVPRRRIFTLVFSAAALCAAFFAVQFFQFETARDVWAAIRRRSVKAALTGVTLNNGNGNVVTGNDITSQTTALSPDIGAYRWMVDGSNVGVLTIPFNAGGTQSDFSGSAANGTALNGAAYTASGCKVGGCLTFDGTDDYVNFGDTTILDGLTAVSFGAWIHPTSYGPGTAAFDVRNILSKSDWFGAASTTIVSGFQGDDAGGAIFYCAVAAATHSGVIVNATEFPLGQWTHFYCVWSSGGATQLYKNGVLLATSGSTASGGLNNTSSALRIGSSDYASEDQFHGMIDEVHIFSRALSSAQVLQNYNDGNNGLGGPTVIKTDGTLVGQLWDLSITPITSSGTVGSAIASSNPVVIASGSPSITGTLDNSDEGSPIISSLTIPGGSTAGYRWVVDGANVANLSFPSQSGATQNDVSGNGNNGAVTGATFLTSGCQVGNCLSYDGSGDYVSVPHASTVDLGGLSAYTISLWAYVPSVGQGGYAMAKGDLASAAGWYVIIDDNDIQLRRRAFPSGSDENVPVQLSGASLTGWMHVVITKSGNDYTVYRNGSVFGTVNSAAAVYANSHALSVGARIVSGSPISFTGRLDEVQIYPRALSQAQVVQNYADGFAGLGGPTRISAQEHSVGQTWDLVATEFLSGGTLGSAGYIDSATIATGVTTTLGITTPVGSQAGNVTINYSCLNGSSFLRDLLVEYSTNGGGVFNNASLVSTSSGSVAGSVLSMVACNSGTSNNSFVWDSLAHSVGNNSTVQIRITAQYPSGPSVTTTNFTVSNGTITTFTTPTTINAGDTTYDGHTVYCSNTTLTINGAHSFNNLFVQSGCTLTHGGPSTTTVTKMTLTISNSFTVASGGTVNLDGKGFFGGGGCGSGSNLGYTSDGLGGGVAVFSQADGRGPAHGGRGISWNGASNTNVYGSVTNPVEPGAGGGEWNGCGGHGGGALIVSAATATLNGAITANAVNAGGWIGGAGGSINIQATGLVSGSGSVSTSGTTGGNNVSGGGGRVALVGSTVTFPTASISNSGGNSNAGAGTIFIKETSDLTRPNGRLFVKGSSTNYATPVSGTFNFDNITVSGGGKLSLIGVSTVSDAILLDNGGLELDTTGSSVVTAGTVTMQNSALLTHYPTGTAQVERLRLDVSGAFTQDATSTVTVAGRGFLGGHTGCGSNSNLGYTSDGAGGMVAVFPQATQQGPAHAGRGINWNGASNTNAYGSVVNPTEPGAGGGEWNGCGGHGGGSIIITAASFTLNGSVNANAVNNSGWIGGAGGTVNLQATGAISGSGTITASGTNGGNNTPGGGGRIALIGSTVTIPVTNITNAGGDANAGVGTIYVKETSDGARPNGKLFIKGSANFYATPVSGTFNFNNITVSNGGKVSLIGVSTVSDAILLDNGGLELDTTGSSVVTAGTVTMQNSALLTHYPTGTSHVERLRLDVSGAFTQDATSTVTVAGRGFLGGLVTCGSNTNLGYTSDGAGGMVAVFPQATQQGPAHAGRGINWNGASNTDAYDSVVNPTEPGAGGGEWNGCGGHGGGSIIMTAATFTLNGAVNANAVNNGGWIGGAGGTVNLQATGAISGSGTITASGTNGGNNTPGGGGRIALIGSTVTIPVTNITNAGGDANAGVGTIFIKQTSDSLRPNGQLYAKGSTNIYGTPVPGSLNINTITVNGGGKINLQGASTVSDGITLSSGGMQIETTGTTAVSAGFVTIQSGGVLTHAGPSTTSQNKINLTVTGAFTLNSGGQVNLDGKGFFGGGACGSGSNLGYSSNGSGGGVAVFPSASGQGPAHGGRGVSWNGTSATNVYDSITNPVEPGGGGGEWNGCGGHGGGAFILTAGSIDVSGTITANAVNAGGWIGGAGGTINLQTTGSLSGNGTMSVSGTGGGTNTSGGGGRIAVVYGSSTYSGSYQAYGGPGSGAAGTIYVKSTSATYGNLTVDNNNSNVAALTPAFYSGSPTTRTFQHVTADHYGKLLLDAPGTAFAVNGIATEINNGQIINNLGAGYTLASVSVITTTMPGAPINVAYSQVIESAGGHGPHTFVCRSGGVTVVCTTVLPTGLNMSSAGVVSGTPTVVGTTLFTVRATEALPGSTFDEETISITVGNGPSAPTSLFSHSSDAQACCSSPITDASPVFSAIFNDADTGNTAAKYRIQVASDAGFSSLLWDSGASGTAIASCAIGARCANINYAGSALTLGGVTYHWRIKYWDDSNLEGVFSSGATFTTSSSPTTPTSLFSNDSTAQTGLTNPVGILAAHPVFSAVFNDPDIGDTATKYRVQVDNNNNFFSPVWDSGASGTSMASCNQGARCADIVFGGADLEANEAVYYWRVKFWDVAGVEGPWSEDPIATTKFTMGIAGGSQQQSGTEPPPQPTVPETPIAGAVQVLDANSVRYNWIDTSSNETGFRILNAEGNVIADVLAGVTQAVEASLPANSLVSGRKVLAYNNQGQSPAVPFASVITSSPRSRPVLVRRGGNSVTFTVEPSFTAFVSQTAVRYELIVTNSQGESRTVTSEWVQQNEYTFQGISAEDSVEVRVITRNQDGVASEPTAYEDVAELSRRFAVNIGVFEKGTNTRSNPINPNSLLAVSMSIESIGSDPASSVVLNLPLPRYILYVPGTLVVDGRGASDGFDGDSAQGDQNGVSADWAMVSPGERHSIAFDLAFDVVALQALRASQEPVATTGEAVAQALAQAMAATNPIINLQASVSFAESDVVYMSPVISIEPDLALTEEPVLEPEEMSVEPEQPQEEQPATVPTPEETSIIEQILQQEFGGPQPESQPGTQPQPTLQTGETITSSDAGTFNVDVTSGDNALGLTGEAEVSGDAIRFTGTTTQPFTVITLIFNDSITAIAVSDANGFWQTFVSADRLGIQPGEEATVKIEAIAAKGDLRSERVSVGDVVVSRDRGGDIVAEFDTTVSDSVFLSVAEEIQHQVVKVIENQEPVIQTTLSVAAPVVVVSSVPLWGYLPYAPTMIYHFITYAIGAIGRKKKMAARFYGVAYDSISKQPLALAIIRIYKVETALPQATSVGAAAASNKKLVTTVVTDKAGRYDALLEPGQYTLEVAKPGYMFPSQIVSTTQDGNFQNVYNGGQGIKVEGESITIPDVPLDPVNAARQWQLASGPKKLWYSMQKVGGFLAVPILIVGAVMSAAVVATIPDKPINWIIAIFYIVLLSLQIKLRQKVEKAWGVVYDIATNAVLPLTTIQLIEPASSKVVTSRLSDYQGRFSFLPEPGKYVIKASKAGYQQVAEVVEAPQTDRQPLHGEVNIEKSDQRISGDIAMRQAI